MDERAGNGGGAPGWAARLGIAVADALLPVQCPGCGAWDTRLCPRCAALARGAGTLDWHVLDGEGEVADVPVWSLGDYEGALRRLILAAKHRPRVDLLAFLRDCGVHLGAAIAGSTLLTGTDVWVVPAPSGWRRRHGGQMVTPALADGVARGIAACAHGSVSHVRVVDALRLRAWARSQSSRDAGERRSGRAGSMRRLVEVPPGASLVLVDDVVTTGATVREAVRVLACPGALVATVCRVGGR